ncbi:hypothetical protein F5B17DRAFT_392301 [Nemania serpens]|nr:hypothetical protein F5B17DRAFT_392301 [Nemania serpens]
MLPRIKHARTNQRSHAPRAQQALLDDGDDDDVISNYGDVECGVMDSTEESGITTTSHVEAKDMDRRKGNSDPISISISSPSSYTGLAALNPYALEGEDLARRLGDELDGDGDVDGVGKEGREEKEGNERRKMTKDEEEKEEKNDDDDDCDDGVQRRRVAELDRACAAVLAEEDAARRALEGLLFWE